MPRAAVLCLSIVAAIQGPLAAAPPASFIDAPVAPAAVAAAEMLGLDPARDREQFLAELTRLLYTPPQGKSPAAALVAGGGAERGVAAGATVRVPVPLSAAIWSSSVFRRRVDESELIGAILTDRRAALLAHTLAGLNEQTLQFFASEPSVLTRLHERGAAAFGAFGVTLDVRDGRVAPPGGELAVPLWEAVVGAPVSAPSRFIAALYGEHGGRLAYLYDTIAGLDEPARAFALGRWIDDAVRRAARFQLLASACVTLYGEWRLDELPFTRPLNDLAMLLLRVDVTPSGAPGPPSSVAFWQVVFSGAFEPVENGDAEPPIDAAWLAATLGEGDMYERGDRLEQFAFGQRLFARAERGQWPDAQAAVRAFPRQRMLMLTLERIGIVDPATYRAVAERARRVSGPPERAFWTLAQLQGAVALIATSVRRGTMDVSTAGPLLRSLVAVPVDDDRYNGALGEWFQTELLPTLPAGETAEARVVAALAGRSPGAAARRVTWEGQEYRLDFAAAETRRLEAVRRKQGGYTLDVALGVLKAAKTLASGAVATSELRALPASLEGVRQMLPPRYAADTDVYARGVLPPRFAQDVIADAVGELSAGGARDARRSARVGQMLSELVDTLLGEALISFAYAADIGDPDGSPMLTRNVALRHDFGFERGSQALKERARWDIPRPYFQPGMPWHVTGSVLGLDLALAPQALRRISSDRLTEAPRLASNQREAFAAGVAVLDIHRLRDADMRALAEAIARGEQRVRSTRDAAALDRVVRDLAVDGWRRNTLQLLIDSGRYEELAAAFSLAELLALGGGAAAADLDAWGMSGLPLAGCVCSRMVLPGRWRVLTGRPQTTLLASAIPDLNLQVALTLHELGLPAALARPVLAAATLDFIEEVSPRDSNDWWALVRAARRVSRSRIEDYVASAAAVDGPLVPVDQDRTSAESTVKP